MRKVGPRTRDDVLGRYREVYGNWSPEHTFYDSKTVGGILATLEALPADASRDQLAAILDGSWVDFWCEACDEYVPEAVEIETNSGYTAYLCRDCIGRAAELMESK